MDSGPWIDCTSPWSPAALSGGDHVVAVRSTDVAGNTDPSPATRSFTVAGPPPALSLLLGTAAVQPVADSVSAGSAEAFAATASASGSVSQVSVYVDVGNTAPSMVVGPLQRRQRPSRNAAGQGHPHRPDGARVERRHGSAYRPAERRALLDRPARPRQRGPALPRRRRLQLPQRGQPVDDADHAAGHLADRAGLGLVRRGGQRRRVARGRRPARSSRIRTPNLPRWEGKTCTSGIA